MPKPYSDDLRKRVIEHYELYGSATLTSQTFHVSRSIIYDWKKIKDATGDIKPKGHYQQGHSHKIENMDKFKEMVEQNSGLTLQALVKKSGIAMSIMTCSRALKKLNITRKKNLWIQRAG